MKRRAFILLVTLLLGPILGACGLVDSGSAASGTETAESTSRLATENAALVVGDTATTTKDGNTLTVLAYESPLPPTNSSELGLDSEFSTIEVEGCASSSSGSDLMYVGSPAFVL